MENCVADVRSWYKARNLKGNDTNTEFAIIGSRQMLSLVNIDSIRVGSADIKPVSEVRNLGVFLDENLSMDKHISQTCGKAYGQLFKLQRIRKYLTLDSTKTLVHAFITGNVDYCNSLLYGVPKCHTDKLQRVLNSAARLVCSIPRFDHITPTLKELHWLPVQQRVTFKIALLVFKCLHGIGPKYLTDMLVYKSSSRYSLRSSQDTTILTVPRTKCKTFGDRSFAFAGPTVWNGLPTELRYIENMERFKSSLKTYLFKLSFNC